jgi:hypothetical protein
VRTGMSVLLGTLKAESFTVVSITVNLLHFEVSLVLVHTQLHLYNLLLCLE